MKPEDIEKLEATIMDSPFKEVQEAINGHTAWCFEGSVGRNMNDHIEAGCCMLGDTGCKDYYGSYIPSRHEVEPGSKGSPEYVAERLDDCIINTYYDDE